MTKALLHGEKDIGIAPRLDMDQPIGMKAGQMKRGSKEIAPAQAPEDRAFASREDAGEENRGARIVGKLGTTRKFVKRTGGNTPRGDSRVDIFDTDRDDVMTRGNAFDSRNFGANIIKYGGLAHGSEQLGERA